MLAVKLFAGGSFPHVDIQVIATNATLSLHTHHLPPLQSVNTALTKGLEIFLVKMWECENKSGKNLPQYDSTRLGKKISRESLSQYMVQRKGYESM